MSDESDNKVLFEGTPEEKIKLWLDVAKDDGGHLRAGVS